MTDEGVIKFTALHTPSAPIAADTTLLSSIRARLRTLGLIGQDPTRYGGAGFGNVSQRHSTGFLITASQTGGLRTLAAEHWVHVLSCDLATNTVTSCGPMLPSSESLTHAALYACSPAIQYVIHVHSPRLWRSPSIPRTAPNIPYGTPAMAHEIRRLWPVLRVTPYLAMEAHEDGVLTYG